MNKFFPLAVIALIASLAAPAVVDHVGGLTLDVAASTTTAMQEVAQ